MSVVISRWSLLRCHVKKSTVLFFLSEIIVRVVLITGNCSFLLSRQFQGCTLNYKEVIGCTTCPIIVWLPYIRTILFQGTILDDMQNLHTKSTRQARKETVQIMKKNNTLIPWKMCYHVCIFTFCGKAFVTLLIQAELCWSRFYKYLHCQSIPAWILNTALKHF